MNTPEELLKYMSDNITYGYVDLNGKTYTDMNDFHDKCIVQTDEELFKTKYGTCWDQTEAERYWFNKNNYKTKTIFIWFEGVEENYLPTHTFLLYQSNGKWYHFENAFEDYRGIHEFNTIDEAINAAIEKHLEYAIKNYGISHDYKKYITYFEYEKPPKNLDVDSYLEYVTKDTYQRIK